MAKKIPLEQAQEFINRGVTHIIPRAELLRKLLRGERLRVYLGVDPTSPIIHLGHAVALRKLRQLQDWGHQVILLIGDFTGLIGDPSDKKAMRRPLSPDEVKANARTYKKQAAKILDFTSRQNPVKLDYNRRWLSRLKFSDILQLASSFTVQQMIEREMFKDRLKQGKPVGLHEFLYPLMQGYDSVALGVDMEIGGNDQLFNMMAGRQLLMSLRGISKIVLTVELLAGTDGRKMSKSYGNVIGLLDSASEMYGKIMSLRDELIVHYFTLCTDVSLKEIRKIARALRSQQVNPRDYKARLALEIVSQYHSSRAARQAAREFERVFKKRLPPKKIPNRQVTAKVYNILDLLCETGLVSSKSQAKRLIEQGGVSLDNESIRDWHLQIEPHNGMIVRVGKRRFVRLIV